MSEIYYEIQIDSVYLTENGTASGLVCRLGVQGVNQLRSNYKRIRLPNAIDGTPIFQVIEVGEKGKDLTITIETLKADVLDESISIIENINENGGDVQIVGIGAIGNFDVSAVPGDVPYEFGEFIDTDVKNVTFRFVTI